MKYLLLSDILGFSNLITNNEKIDVIITDWVRELESIHDNEIEITLLSDTIFAVTNSLNKIIHYGKQLLEKSFTFGLPIRGVIVFGNIENNALIYGDAVIKAHQFESIQNWMGITIDYNSISYKELTAHYESKDLIQYLVPIKSGTQIVAPVINWLVNDTTQIYDAFNKYNKNYDLDARVSEMCNNTIEFFVYKRILKANALDPRKYHYINKKMTRPSAIVYKALEKIDDGLLKKYTEEEINAS